MKDPPVQELSDKARPAAAGAAHSTRSIRSYVIRAGRITQAQQRALEQLWPRYGVEFRPEPLELARLFGRRSPCVLEIGFGNGENLAERAAREPEIDFIGVEVHRPGVGHALLAATRAGCDNLRVIAHDAVEVLERQIPRGSLDEVQVLFPDPWPKKRHHKRRLLQPAFIELAASRLRPGGRLHIATDWEPYAEQIGIELAACPALTAASATVARSATRFERRGERLGHRIREFLFIRTASD
ncbi:MAG TPA: tRNA (guanosine(46)-N7)-methyltransferase TrmB [Steroidobacteraceae bacterium]|jgi:tRNA (guanine-N7-)-methyltransferase|nr:tRNA (guanosine(46)-N7)-methyltransferase TrmB [Steroidobacteraceae bacterium]